MTDQLNLGGGIVTTVKKLVTDDLDVHRILKENDVKIEDETPVDEEQQAAGDAPTKEEKPVVKAEAPGAANDGDNDEVDVTKLPKNVQSLINRANREQRIARRDADELRSKLNELASDVERLKKTGGAKVEVPSLPTEPVEPDPAEFATIEEYKAANKKFISDMVDYRLALSKTRDKAEAVDEEIAKEDAETIGAYKSKELEYKKLNPDYEADMREADVELSPVMFSMVLEEGPYLGHYFALHPDESNEIKAITDDPRARKSERAYRQAEQRAMRLVDRIIIKLNDDIEAKSKAKLADEKKPEPKKQPEPIKRVNDRGGAPPKDPAKLTLKEKEELARQRGEINY